MWRIVLLALLTATLLSGCGGVSETTVFVEAYPPISISYPAIEAFGIGSPIEPVEPIIEGGPPTNWFVSPELPAGIILDPETGIISGVPLEVQTPSLFVIQAENESGQVSTVITLQVIPAAPCDVGYGLNSVQVLLGSDLDPLVPEHSCGAVDLWSIAPELPDGLILDPETGIISGIPVVVNSIIEYAITATNDVGSSLIVVVIEVVGTPPCDLDYLSSQLTLLVDEPLGPLVPTVSCGIVDDFSVIPALPAGLVLDSSTGVIFGTPEQVTESEVYQFIAGNAFGGSVFSMEIRVDPQAPCDLNYPGGMILAEVGEPITPLLPSVGCGHAAQFSAEPPLPAGFELDQETGEISGVPELVYEPQIHTIVASNVTGDVSFPLYVEVGTAPCNLSYLQSELVLTMGATIADMFPASGCGIIDLYQISPALPLGLHLDPISGVISGTTLEASGETLYEIQGSNPQGESTTLLLITVLPDAPCDLQYPFSEVVLSVGDALNSGTPIYGCGIAEHFSVSPQLPTGLEIDSVSGLISGIPTEVVSGEAYLVTASNVSGNATTFLQIEIRPQAPCDLSYPTSAVSLEVDQVLAPLIPTVSCGPVDNFSVLPPLPLGLSLDPVTGEVSGVSTQAHQQSTHTITATNISGSVSFSLLFEVVPPAPCDLSYPQADLVLEADISMSEMLPSVGCGAVESYQISPDLPAGISLNPATGAISGTPVEEMPETEYEVEAVNQQGSTSTILTIEVVRISPCDLDYGSPEIVLVIGEPLIPLIPTVGCGVVDEFSVTPSLPVGLLLDPSTGVIVGTPEQITPAEIYQIIAGNTFGSSIFSLQIVVNPQAPCALSYPGGILLAEVGEPVDPLLPAVSCGPVSHYSVEPGLPPGLELNLETGEISGIAELIYEPQIHTVTASNVSGETSFSLYVEVVDAPCNLNYPETELVLAVGVTIVDLVPTSGCGSIDLFQIAPDLPLGLQLDPVTGVISGTTLEASEETLYEIQGSNPQGQSSILLLITVLPDAPCDLQYPFSEIVLSVGETLNSGAPIYGCGIADLFSVSPQLPGGLELDAVSGVISGTPAGVVAMETYQVTATNVSGSSTVAFQMAVNPQAPCDLEYPASLLVVEIGEVLEPQIPTVGCGPVDSFSMDPSLPAGLTFDTTTGEISGAGVEIYPAAVHDITATNVTGEVVSSILIEITAPAVPCDFSYPVEELVLTTGQEMSELVPTVGCALAESFHITPALPDGIALDSVSGILSGTPVGVSDTTLYEIQASNAFGGTVTSLLLTVVPEAPCDLSYPVEELELTVGENFPEQVPSVGCGGVDLFQVSPQLPPGLQLDAVTGVLSGVATEVSSATSYLIGASNSQGGSSTVISITVLPDPPCDLSYPLSAIIVDTGEEVSPLEPILSCGAVENWQVDPPLPLGLVLDDTGVISGIPLVVHAQQVHLITAANVSGSTSFELSIWVQEVAPCDLVYPDTNLSLLLGNPLPSQIPAVGCGEVALFSISPGLPAGLEFDSLTGTISGSPLEVLPVTNFQVIASNEGGNAVTDLSIEVLGQEPCQLHYPELIIGQPAGVPMIPQVPTIQCGPPDIWLVTPGLPAGLDMDPTTGVISGTPLSEGESTHVVRAENSFGSTEVTIQIVIRSVFRFRGGPLEIPYSSVTGEGNGSLALSCIEGDQNPGFPTSLSGLSMAIQHDTERFTFAGSAQGSALELLNGGSGPDFWAVNSIDGEVLVGLLVSFAMVDFLVCSPEIEIVVIDFETNPLTLAGNSEGVTGFLEWGNPDGTPPLDNLVVIDGQNSVDPILETISYDLIPQ